MSKFIIGLFVGAVAGFFYAAMCKVADDENMPKPIDEDAEAYWSVVDDLKYGRYYICSNCSVHSHRPTKFCPDCKQSMANYEEE